MVTDQLITYRLVKLLLIGWNLYDFVDFLTASRYSYLEWRSRKHLGRVPASQSTSYPSRRLSRGQKIYEWVSDFCAKISQFLANATLENSTSERKIFWFVIHAYLASLLFLPQIINWALLGCLQDSDPACAIGNRVTGNCFTQQIYLPVVVPPPPGCYLHAKADDHLSC